MMEGFTLEDLGVKNVEELVEGLVRLFGSEERFIRAFVRISDKERLLRILDDERALRGLGEEQLVRLLGQERILRTLIQKFGIERVQQIIQQVAQEESQSHQEG